MLEFGSLGIHTLGFKERDTGFFFSFGFLKLAFVSDVEILNSLRLLTF